jgi:hypothetical protein
MDDQPGRQPDGQTDRCPSERYLVSKRSHASLVWERNFKGKKKIMNAYLTSLMSYKVCKSSEHEGFGEGFLGID